MLQFHTTGMYNDIMFVVFEKIKIMSHRNFQRTSAFKRQVFKGMSHTNTECAFHDLNHEYVINIFLQSITTNYHPSRCGQNCTLLALVNK